MLMDTELELLLNDLESDRVERKASLAGGEARERIKQAICAFANDMPDHRQPGVVFIGANDDGSSSRIVVSDDLLLLLSQMRDNILPIPSMVVQKRIFAGNEYAVVIVEPSHSPPVLFDGRIWIRVGPRRAIARTHLKNI